MSISISDGAGFSLADISSVSTDKTLQALRPGAGSGNAGRGAAFDPARQTLGGTAQGFWRDAGRALFHDSKRCVEPQ